MRAVDPRLLQHARAARSYLAATILLGLAVTGLIIAQAALLAHVLSAVVAGSRSEPLAGALVLLLGVVLARAVAAYGGEAAALRAAARIKSQLRRKLAGHCLRLGPAWLGRQQPGEIAALATRGLDGLDPYFARYLPQLVLSVTIPVAVVATVTATDWISGLVIVVTLPLIPLFAAIVGLHTKAQTRRQWHLLAQLSGHFLDVVQGLPTLKLFGRASHQEHVIARVCREHRQAAMATLRVAFLSALVLELSAALATAIVAVETGLRLLYGHMPYQAALLVLLLTPEAYLPLRAVAAQFHASAEGTAAAESVFGIIETPLESGAAPAPSSGTGPASPVPDLHSAPIVLDQVTVSYPGRDVPALAGLSLEIGPGELIVLRGASGSGKSTLLAMLLKFVQPSAGVVRAGHTELSAVLATPWRAQVAWVPQNPRLFHGTVADNIALGQPGAARSEIEHAARLAGADAFIDALPRDYDTPLGERATRLSAGQRQQLALARAFLREAPLLLLDEPTAHLAPPAAAAIRDVIAGPMAGRTIIVATHRNWDDAGAGKVVVLDGGRPAQLASVPTGSSALTASR